MMPYPNFQSTHHQDNYTNFSQPLSHNFDVPGVAIPYPNLQSIGSHNHNSTNLSMPQSHSFNLPGVAIPYPDVQSTQHQDKHANYSLSFSQRLPVPRAPMQLGTMPTSGPLRLRAQQEALNNGDVPMLLGTQQE